MALLKAMRFIRSILLVLLPAIIAFHASLAVVIGLEIAHFREHNPTTTSIIRYRGADSGRAGPSFTPLSGFPADLVRTVLFAEDGYFFHHSGISPRYIQHALEINRRLGYTAYGGSTITQQLARTLFLNPGKNYVRKYLEALIALELEILLEKERILELYLNYIELGDGIYGFTEAARIYYNKSLLELAPDEKLALITVMPSPLTVTPFTYEKNGLLRRRFAFIERYYQVERNQPPRFESTIIENQ